MTNSVVNNTNRASILTRKPFPTHPEFTSHLARPEDKPAILALIDKAISANMQAFLTPREITAARETMGLDNTLIEDQTYFLIEAKPDPIATAKGKPTPKTLLVGCGGWGKRKTLYGGNHSAGRDDHFSDPATQPARIRAMYTHPDWTRQGIGNFLIALGEHAAREHGFKTIELGATLAGEPLYKVAGYKEFHRETHSGPEDIKNIIIHMRKNL